jgi:hypothetical protein
MKLPTTKITTKEEEYNVKSPKPILNITKSQKGNLTFHAIVETARGAPAPKQTQFKFVL